MLTESKARSRFLVLLSVASLQFGCESAEMRSWRAPQEFVHQEDAGSAHVAVLSVAPFDDYKAALQPTFKLTEDQALATTLATTQVSEDRLLDLLQVAAKLSLPTSGTAASKTESTSEGTTTETSSKTTSTAPGDVSKLAPPTLSTTAPPAGKSLADTALGTDPMLRFWAATALYQEAALLSRYVKDAAVRRDFTPYVVRLQISLLPAARNEPYDAYTSISFFEGDTSAASIRFTGANVPPAGAGTPAANPTQAAQLDAVLSDVETATSTLEGQMPKTNQEALQPLLKAVKRYQALKAAPTRRHELIVVPLLVTDNLESSAQSATLDRIRQQAFSLAFLLKGVAGQTDFVKYSNRLESVFGRDYNSLMTVARVTDNTYRVRLGALQQVGTSLAMVPRTNEATFLLLVPKVETPTQVALTAQTTFVNARTGKPLEMRSTDDVHRLLDDIGDRYCRMNQLSYEVLEEPSIEGTSTRCLQSGRSRVNLLELQAHVQENDVEAFDLALDASFPMHKRPTAFPAESLWVDLANVMVGSRYASTSFELPKINTPVLFPSQTGIVTDDGKKQATLTLQGGQNLVAEKLSAILVTAENKGMRLFSSEVHVRPGGTAADFVFTSPKSLDPKYAGPQSGHVEVTCERCFTKPEPSGIEPIALLENSYSATILTPKDDTEKKTVFTAKAFAAAIGRDTNAKGNVTLAVDFTKEAAATAGKDGALSSDKTLAFEVNGASVDKATWGQQSNNGPNKFEITTRLPLQIVIALSSLAPPMPVTVTVQEKIVPELSQIEKAAGKKAEPIYIPIAEFHYVVY